MTPQWAIVYTREFSEWFERLNTRHSRAIVHRLELLGAEGPALGRPHVDHIKGSKYSNMKELRVNSDVAIRIFFCFDSRRQAVMLIGAEKLPHRSWYRQMIRQAEAIMDFHERNETS